MEISGKVIKGNKYGRVLGFPTANLDRREYVRKKIKVRLGVWAGNALLQTTNNKQQAFSAAIVIGPIDSTGNPKIEAHLLNFKGDLYGKKVTVELKKYIRPFKRYKDQESLKKQIKRDVETIKKLKF